MLGCLDMRSSGYFHVSKDTLQQKMKSSFKDNCLFLSEDETSEYFDLYNKDHKEVVNYIKSEVNCYIFAMYNFYSKIGKHHLTFSKRLGHQLISLKNCISNS